ncbi:hypothetical protein M4V62_01360 [Streptomyces durmitorensis]|uniref:Secreted protein n=1 Tax=Streptomyces durmitorensis TaxID=319947 RepID=A0ABY4PLT9_9ACTN|nr:hypothetical protein [Streptomyces durmitorensis]UQT53829.1 hypothetical protein M4V62_01360 [Streptomyces durmitorensis]
MSDRTAQRAAAVIASVLTVDALFHLSWATDAPFTPPVTRHPTPARTPPIGKMPYVSDDETARRVRAAPDCDGTRVAFTGGVRVPGRAAWQVAISTE